MNMPTTQLLTLNKGLRKIRGQYYIFHLLKTLHIIVGRVKNAVFFQMRKLPLRANKEKQAWKLLVASSIEKRSQNA
jgi:hypothetical protein